ncbi:MAG: serine aminopeptidase domain-containing protein, partial [bacterium]
TTAGGPDYVPPSQEAISLFLSTNGSPRELIRKKLGLAFTESYLQGDEVERLIDLRLANPQPRHAYLAQMAAAANFNLSDCDHEIQAPCLIAAATDDKMVPLANAHNLAKKIRNSQLKIYQGLGHQFFVESSEQFNKDVIEFLTDTS